MNNQLGKKIGKNFPEANNSKGFFKSIKNIGKKIILENYF